MRVNNKGHQEIQSEKYPVLQCELIVGKTRFRKLVKEMYYSFGQNEPDSRKTNVKYPHIF